ncbi:MAG: hypothetical protein HY830_24765, partial [Actinobacteria bacterium]|nr:hypothetical protein [Actinomycetota bacterium]
MSPQESWFERLDGDLSEDADPVEHGLRTALRHGPAPVVDPVAAVRAARARGTRIVRRRRGLAVVGS